jgi:DNA-binding transcriptional regulator YdaS (Cro superfamily)
MNIHIEKAVEFFKSDAAFARAIGVSKTAVKKMKTGEIRITAERANQIERVTGGFVTRHDLRPDIFDPPVSDAIDVRFSVERNDRQHCS